MTCLPAVFDELSHTFVQGSQGGRPLEYSETTAAIIIQRLEEGWTLERISKAVDMPFKTTIYRWMDRVPGFATAFARARVRRSHSWADQAVQETLDAVDRDGAAIAKVRLDALKWAASVANPKDYSEAPSAPQIIDNRRMSLTINAPPNTDQAAAIALLTGASTPEPIIDAEVIDSRPIDGCMTDTL